MLNKGFFDVCINRWMAIFYLSSKIESKVQQYPHKTLDNLSKIPLKQFLISLEQVQTLNIKRCTELYLRILLGTRPITKDFDFIEELGKIKSMKKLKALANLYENQLILIKMILMSIDDDVSLANVEGLTLKKYDTMMAKCLVKYHHLLAKSNVKTVKNILLQALYTKELFEINLEALNGFEEPDSKELKRLIKFKIIKSMQGKLKHNVTTIAYEEEKEEENQGPGESLITGEENFGNFSSQGGNDVQRNAFHQFGQGNQIGPPLSVNSDFSVKLNRSFSVESFMLG